MAKALNEGCQLYSNSQTEGNDNYPHRYNDYEGFDFPISGPYQEFPIKESGVYYGGKNLTSEQSSQEPVDADQEHEGSPGADRIVFNADCEYAGSITHTGASGNNFVGCSDTS